MLRDFDAREIRAGWRTGDRSRGNVRPSTRCRCDCTRPKAGSASSPRETPASSWCSICLAGADRRALLDKPSGSASPDARSPLRKAGRRETPGAVALHPSIMPRPNAGSPVGRRSIDGVVAKRRDDALPPRRASMVKVKRMRTADCVVGGFRYAEGSGLVGSLLLGLYDDEGGSNHVGFTSAIRREDRPALTKKLEGNRRRRRASPARRRAGPAAGAPNAARAWQPLRPELVVEVVTTRSPVTASATAPTAALAPGQGGRANVPLISLPVRTHAGGGRSASVTCLPEIPPGC